MESTDHLAKIRSLKYGSKELIDAVDEAMDEGIDGETLEAVLLSMRPTNWIPPDENQTELKRWQQRAGKPNQNLLIEISKDAKCRKDSCFTFVPGRAKLPIRSSHDRRRNGEYSFTLD